MSKIKLKDLEAAVVFSDDEVIGQGSLTLFLPDVSDNREHIPTTNALIVATLFSGSEETNVIREQLLLIAMDHSKLNDDEYDELTNNSFEFSTVTDHRVLGEENKYRENDCKVIQFSPYLSRK